MPGATGDRRLMKEAAALAEKANEGGLKGLCYITQDFDGDF